MYQDIQKFLASDWVSYRGKFTSSLATEMPLLNKVNAYMLEHGGKQLRPTLALLTAKALRGFCNDNVICCAAASEMLHTATLLHDDVADDSPLRRGAPTVMALFSPTASVLVGDFWLSRAVDIIVDHPDKRVIKIFSKCLQDLAEGEMLQIEKSHSLDMTEEDYFRIIYSKTASLFEAAVISAAYSVEASDEELAAVGGFACHLGHAFQIMDDIFDYSPQMGTGKPAGLDILEKKITLPLLGAFASAEPSAVESLKAGIHSIGIDREADMETVREASRMVASLGGIDFARGRLKRECGLAASSLDALPPSEAKDFLVSLAYQMSERQM